MGTDQTVQFSGRILFLCEDPEALRRQLAGEDLTWDPESPPPLIDNISTDEITPGWVCFYYDETLGEYTLVGLRNGVIERGSVAGGGFDVIVSGRSKGCGSSRETAPYSELYAGVRLVIARSIEKIYQQNCDNIGLLTSTDLGLIERIRRGETFQLSDFARGRDPISAAIIQHGGLSGYNRERLEGRVAQEPITTPPRPLNLVEKILAAHAVVDAREGRTGVPAVAPGDAFFARTDVRFSHEYVTPMAAAIFERSFGAEARVKDPDSVYAFRDHLTFLPQVMPEAHKKMGLLERAAGLAVTQEEFARKHGIQHYGEVPEGGSEAICHNGVLDDIALPGMVVCGTDSHTCTAGALGCFAFGVGSTDMANAWYTQDVRVRVPEVARFHLSGELADDVTAKDLILHLMAQEFLHDGGGIGKVLYFDGPGLASLPMGERATLTNMAVEAGGFTGLCAPDEVTVEYLTRARGLDREILERMIVQPDEGASYAREFAVDLDTIQPMVATPGDPRNGVPVDSLPDEVPIDIAYGGSCTGGKVTDMDMYARIFQAARERGEKVAPGVALYLQFGSQKVKEYARQKGYLELFEAVGARLINPSCGACIKAGPGVSGKAEEVTVSAANRNFPGRSGPGQVYLASPYVVAASALAGRIVRPGAVAPAPR